MYDEAGSVCAQVNDTLWGEIVEQARNTLSMQPDTYWERRMNLPGSTWQHVWSEFLDAHDLPDCTIPRLADARDFMNSCECYVCSSKLKKYYFV